MGRRTPSRSNETQKREAWTAQEDKILAAYITAHGQGKWMNIPRQTGLRRCGKSCRLRWMNYLRPDIKRGNITDDEQDLILRLHRLLGNRWSLIAGRLPGRTDNEIKNYWNTNLAKREHQKRSKDVEESRSSQKALDRVPLQPAESPATHMLTPTMEPKTGESYGDSDVAVDGHQSWSGGGNVDGALMDFDFKDVDLLELLDLDFSGIADFDMLVNMDDSKQEGRQSDFQLLSFPAETENS